MKKIILIQLVFVISLFSCKNAKDYFVGKWVDCNSPNKTADIKILGDVFLIELTDGDKVGEAAAKIKSEDVLVARATDGQLVEFRYDKETKRIALHAKVKNEEKIQFFCRQK